MNLSCPVFVLLSINTICHSSSATTTLKLVQIIFRHGISTPENSFPTDSYKDDSDISSKRGLLTQDGKEEQYNLGRLLASRYDQFSNGSFKPNDVTILSSDFQNTISSANLFLLGLLDLNPSSPILVNNLIKVIPCQDDNLLSFCKDCPKHRQLSNEVMFRYSVRNALEDDRYIFDYMSTHSGLDIQTIQDFSELYSTLYYQRFSNLTVPHWADALFTSGALDRILSVILKLPTSTTELKRLKGGPILKLLTASMSTVVNELNPNISKLQVFSGHGETLVSLLDCLDLFDGHIPSFSSAVILELHQDDSMHFHVEIFSSMQSGELTEFKRLWVPTCGFTCPWSAFHRIINPYLIGDFDVECQTASFPWNALLWAFILLASFPILLVFFIKILEKRRTDKEFSPLLNSHKIF